MGQLYLDYLDGDNIYICAKCKAHLTNYNYLLSKVNLSKLHITNQGGPLNSHDSRICPIQPLHLANLSLFSNKYFMILGFSRKRRKSLSVY